MPDSEAPYRLPRGAVPSRYDLTVEPDLDAGSFAGTLDIAVSVREPLTEIVLNAKELEVSGARFTATDRSEVEVVKVRVDDEAERIHLELAETARPGQWSLRLEYRGRMNDKLTGFYRSRYTDAAGATRTIATTHFEATDARRAFPCWDEPDLKATFGVTLVVPEGLTALSNGPEVEREPLGDGRVRVRFADTMVMATYLVAFVVGPLVVTEARDANGTPMRVACVPGKEHLVGFALDVGVFALNFFADYYGIPYPDRKVDHVSLPDFAQGAMENLGCITYRETLLLADPENATKQELEDIAATIAHELAHMWFGDLVTMRWWNGIWLNEAFATFMESLTVDAWRPDWEVWLTFARARANALEVDALESTRPIEYPVHSPDDASGMFDTLTYTKGGAVLRMLEQWLGAERFREGIRRYLRTHAYGNTETHDLWDALEAETGEPVRRIMDAWIFQPGYPAIHVGRDGDVLRLTQRRFVPSRSDDDTTWPVPLLVRQVWDGGDQVHPVIVEAEGLELPLASPDAVVIANAGGSSFVRTWYDHDLRTRLIARAPEVLSTAERHDLVDDAWSAVVAGTGPSSSFLDLVEGLRDEEELPVWQAILTGVAWCDRFIDGDAREQFRDWVRRLVRPAFERLGWEPADGESDLARALRGQLAQAMGILGNDPEAQAMARELELEARNGTRVDAQLAAAAVEVVAHSGGPGEYEALWTASRSVRTPQEEHRYLFALPRFRDAGLMDRTLSASLTDLIRPQDGPFVIARATMNRDLGPRAWRFIVEHWDEINDRFASSNIIAMASGIRFLTDPSTVEDVQAFFREHDIPQNHIMLRQHLERQRVTAALAVRVGPELRARFAR
jgi:puromycin-sensitive aminopeptidase